MIPDAKIEAIADAVDAAREFVTDADDVHRLCVNTIAALTPSVFHSQSTGGVRLNGRVAEEIIVEMSNAAYNAMRGVVQDRQRKAALRN